MGGSCFGSPTTITFSPLAIAPAVVNGLIEMKGIICDCKSGVTGAGRKPTQLKRDLIDRFGVAFYCADRVVRTESAHIAAQSAQQRYIDSGITEMQVWASKDERRCDVCGKLHKKKYPVHAISPLPAHPNCRCTLIPVI